MPNDKLLIPVKKCRPLSGAFTWPPRLTLASPSAADLLPLGQLSGDLKQYAAA